MVRLTVAFVAPSPSAGQEILETLRYLEPATRLQRGCLKCANWADDERTIHHVEEWETEQDMRHRVSTDAFTMLLEMAEAAREPRVQFDFIDVTRGLDYVAEVRGDFGG